MLTGLLDTIGSMQWLCACAGINITTPRQAAKEYLVAHDIASAAPGMVAKPYGAWIHEEVDGDMKVVVLNTPMPQGRDLNSVKIAVVGNDEDNQVCTAT